MAHYDLTHAAEEDLRGIWHYTHETWGAAQADTYLDRIKRCCEAIAPRFGHGGRLYWMNCGN